MAVKSPKKTIKSTASALRALRKDASVEDVHKVRTGLRRIEALTCRDLPKQLHKLRKRAGDVRDLDVFAKLFQEFASLSDDAGANACIRSAIDDQRRRRAAKLVKVANACKPARLRDWAKRHSHAPVKTGELMQQVRDLGEDQAFVQVTAENLHDLRLKIKPIRYRAEALQEEDASRLAELCNDVQSAIGRWHDHLLLLEFCEAVLKQPEHPMLEALRQRCGAEFEECRNKVSLFLQDARQPRPPAIALVRGAA